MTIANTPVPVITVDGPSGTGKGTLCQRLATKLNWHFLDSGALYRVLAMAALKHGVELDNEEQLSSMARVLDVSFDDDHVILEMDDVSDAIRTEECGNNASKVAALPMVRSALLSRQHDFRQSPGLVADGRDMGTVVFMDAELKIFLTASAKERAQRRHKQLKDKGIDVSLARLVQDISERDARDRERTVSPLRPADDAIELDTSELGIDDVFAEVMRLASQYSW